MIEPLDRNGKQGDLPLQLALFGPLVVYGVILGLHLALPGRWIDGYVLDPATGRPLRYRLNGLRVLFATVALYALACALGWIPWEFFYLHRWEMAAGACGLGLLVHVCDRAARVRRTGAFSRISTSGGSRIRSGAAGASTPRCSCIWSAP